MNELLMREVELVSGGSRAGSFPAALSAARSGYPIRNIIPSDSNGANRQYYSNPDLDNRRYGTNPAKRLGAYD
jgi:hypothetical protein